MKFRDWLKNNRKLLLISILIAAIIEFVLFIVFEWNGAFMPAVWLINTVLEFIVGSVGRDAFFDTLSIFIPNDDVLGILVAFLFFIVMFIGIIIVNILIFALPIFGIVKMIESFKESHV